MIVLKLQTEEETYKQEVSDYGLFFFDLIMIENKRKAVNLSIRKKGKQIV